MDETARQEAITRLNRIIDDLAYLIGAEEVLGHDTRRRLAKAQRLIVFLREELEAE